MVVSEELLEMVVCPACRGRLAVLDTVSLRCTRCARVYPIVDGISVLLVERAGGSSLDELKK